MSIFDRAAKEPRHDGRDSYVETSVRPGVLLIEARLAVLERVEPGAYVSVRDADVEVGADGKAVLVLRVDVVGPPPPPRNAPPRKPRGPQFDGC